MRLSIISITTTLVRSHFDSSHITPRTSKTVSASGPSVVGPLSTKMAEHYLVTFWVRGGMNLRHAVTSPKVEQFLDKFENAVVVLSFVIMPVWTLERDFSLEELTLYRNDGETSVSFSNGMRHGSWTLNRWDPDHRHTTFLDVSYQKGDEPDENNLKTRRFELIWGTSTFVKRPDGPDDPLHWSMFLIPRIDQTQHLDMPHRVERIPQPMTQRPTSCNICYGNGVTPVMIGGHQYSVSCPECWPSDVGVPQRIETVCGCYSQLVNWVIRPLSARVRPIAPQALRDA